MLNVTLPSDREPVDITTDESDVAFTAACIPGPGSELSLLPLQKPEHVAANETLVNKLREISITLGADKLYAPTPTQANGLIIEPTALNLRFMLGSGVLMFRNPAQPADGTVLRQPGDAGIFSAAGCGIIVATMDEHLVFAHAARESLLDKQRVMTGQSSRHHESVVDSIVDYFHDHGYGQLEFGKLRVWMFYFIRPEDMADSYEHPVHGEYNYKVGRDVERLGVERMYDDSKKVVMLDLPAIAEAQFKKLGVPAANINLDNCYLPQGLPHTRNGGGRTLLAIVRR